MAGLKSFFLQLFDGSVASRTNFFPVDEKSMQNTEAQRSSFMPLKT